MSYVSRSDIMESSKSKKRVLSLKEKIQVLEWYDNYKCSVRNLATKFQIGKTQAANIIKNKAEILKKWESNGNVDEKKSFLKTSGLKIDTLAYEWFTKARNKNIPLSGTIVKGKAKEIAESLGISTTFKASEGWLENFRIRHNIAFKCISGESANVNEESVFEFYQRLPSLIRGYSPENIYNADETGLFFRALPDKTLALKREKCSGGKLSKERVTVLLCTSMAGNKEPLLVIGKSARPRAFNRVSMNSLPVEWKSNKKAWMTCQIMTEWLLQFDRKMKLQHRKIILFLDNAASHPRDLTLTNIKILFLPPNTTAVCQPLDQGIIKNFKTFYRLMILKHILAHMDEADNAQDLSKSIDQLDAIYFMKRAWDQVNDQTVKNCFQKCKFSYAEDLDDYDPEDDIPLAVYVQMKRALVATGNSNVNVDDFMDLDNQLDVEDDDIDSTISDIIEISEEPEENEEVDTQCTIKNLTDALTAVKNLKLYAKNEEDFNAFNLAAHLEAHYTDLSFQCNKKKQTTLLDFFTKTIEK